MSGSAFPRLEDPVALTVDEVSVVRPTIAIEAGRQAAMRKIHEGILRPFDIVNARVKSAELLFVPFWRVTLALEGALPLRRGAADELPARAKALSPGVVICARRAFPYEPRLAVPGRWSASHPLESPLEQVVGYERAADDLARGEIVEPDLDRSHAEGIATGVLFRAWRFASMFAPTWEPRVTDAKFFLYPMVYAAYSYAGEARREPHEELFVALSGTTGAVVAATYPSAARAVAAKVRRLLSFDRRL